jgi:putative transposase
MPDARASRLGNVGHENTCPTYDYRQIFMRYRRSKTPGATYFFTVVTFRRRPFLTDLDNVELLRTAFRTVKTEHPFTIDAFVLLPQHFHCLLTLPLGDMNYPMRWSAIKKYFTDHCLPELKTRQTAAQLRKRAQTVWQARYWEHQIRDEQDFEKHCDYIHWNPVKHGLVAHPGDWLGGFKFEVQHRYLN